MGKSQRRKLLAYLPLVFLTTSVVVLAPTVFVFWLRESGAVSSMWVALAIGVALSLAVSHVGAVIWKTRANSDLLFSELMVWGWVQRFRSEHRLAAASDLLGLSVGQPKAVTGGQLSGEQKEQLLTQITSSLESSDPYTHGHSRRVARHAANIAKHMGLPGADVAKIRAAGAMHDVGKVDTPTTVLHKAGKLTDEEFDIVKRHPVDGADMVATLNDDELTAIVRHHHERLDGTGYPDGLAGDQIPLGARILAVADTFDAITSTRPYRQANPHKKALDILEVEAGTQLDPVAVKAFLECYSGIKPVAFWSVLINARPRVTTSLGQFFSPVTGTNVMATTAAAAAAGAVAVGPGAHTVPASSQADPTDTATVAAPSSMREAGRKTTVLAAMLADSRARRSGRPTSDSPQIRAKTAEGSDPGPSVSLGTLGSQGNASDDGATPAQDRTQNLASDGGDTRVPAANGGHVRSKGPKRAKDNKGKANGHGQGNSDGRQPTKGRGNDQGQANGQGKNKGQGKSNGKSNGQGKAKRNGNGPGQGIGRGKNIGPGDGNPIGPGKGLEKVKDKVKNNVSPPIPVPGGDGVWRPKR